ncbi:4-hydroxybenzoyl-CoA thioesterase family active site [hydrothermal vent metagenome]|uniref:4-hydroxybenzoyl-CoA thioesterase family active site n=2 Tax=hydrothermal vent metagenome TaxID=652676 RepID=A0A3B1BMT4_9ZZZZ
MSKTDIDIFYEDTDCGGVVYYANYLKYFERARTLMMTGLGVDLAGWAKKNVAFTVYRVEVDYKGSAVYGDSLVIKTDIADMKGSRLTFNYVVINKRTGDVIAKGLTKMCCVNERMKPRRIPGEILEKIK